MYMKEVSEGAGEGPRQSGSRRQPTDSSSAQETPSLQALEDWPPPDCVEASNMPAFPAHSLGRSHKLPFSTLPRLFLVHRIKVSDMTNN